MKPSHKATAGHTRETTADTPACHPNTRRTTHNARSIEIRNPLIVNEMTFRLIDTPKTLEIAVTR
jgi:hypothetical protein